MTRDIVLLPTGRSSEAINSSNLPSQPTSWPAVLIYLAVLPHHYPHSPRHPPGLYCVCVSVCGCVAGCPRHPPGLYCVSLSVCVSLAASPPARVGAWATWHLLRSLFYCCILERKAMMDRSAQCIGFRKLSQAFRKVCSQGRFFYKRIYIYISALIYIYMSFLNKLVF